MTAALGLTPTRRRVKLSLEHVKSVPEPTKTARLSGIHKLEGRDVAARRFAADRRLRSRRRASAMDALRVDGVVAPNTPASSRKRKTP